MTTLTYHAGPSRPEVEMLLRAAARTGSPREHGQEAARRTAGSLVAALASVAAAVAVYDLALLAGA